MQLYSLNLTHNEISFVRQSLDTVMISGKDAKFLAELQIKVENELVNIATLKQEEEIRKQAEFQHIQYMENQKQKNKSKD